MPIISQRRKSMPAESLRSNSAMCRFSLPACLQGTALGSAEEGWAPARRLPHLLCRQVGAELAGHGSRKCASSGAARLTRLCVGSISLAVCNYGSADHACLLQVSRPADDLLLLLSQVVLPGASVPGEIGGMHLMHCLSTQCQLLLSEPVSACVQHCALTN